ncbi:MAG: hypothetical protein QF830_06420 [Rhodospirillales bacterium]|nr:hypothetical protein [Rhodospirillales bacterium]
MARLVSAMVAGLLACGLVGTAALAEEKEEKEVWVPVANKAKCSVWDFPLERTKRGPGRVSAATARPRERAC